MTPFQRGIIFINTNQAKPDDFRSYKDLLDPRWKGRIVADDPRVSGPGNASFEFFYLHPELGPDFIRALARQELFIVRDRNQQVDLVGTGRYPILLGGSDNTVEERIQAGAPIAIVEPPRLREGSDVSPANGVVALFNNAPHPNAAKVYLHWLLSREGQIAYGREMGYPSARTDVVNDHLPAWRMPLPNAIKTYTEAGQAQADAVEPFLLEVFGR
jgi:ABC-type Fe3+ transport system substrate-binding protein